MLIGCCHCGEEPSESIPPSESESQSESIPPSDSDDGPSYSEITSSCIASFGCAAIPQRLTWTVPVATGNWDGSPDCLCPNYDGTHVLKYCGCYYEPGPARYVLVYATDTLGVWRGRPGFPNTDLIGCRNKAPGACSPFVAALSNTRLYYCVVLPGAINVYSTQYYTSTDVFPFTATQLGRAWTFVGSVNCLATSSYTLTPIAATARLDGCTWGTGTLSPG